MVGGLWFVVCGWWFVVCGLWFVACDWWLVNKPQGQMSVQSLAL
jgi:hypothetical protein